MSVELDSSFTVAVENYIQFDIPLTEYPPSEIFLECQEFCRIQCGTQDK